MRFLIRSIGRGAVALCVAAVTAMAVIPAAAAQDELQPAGRWATVEPGPDGLAVVVGEPGLAPRVVARLSVGGMESRMWTGYSCLTGSGRYLATSFAPAEFVDDPILRNQGAFLAIVDLDGEHGVRILDELVALKYHTPGCGPDQEVAAVRHLADGPDGQSATEVLAIDAETATVRWRETTAGKLTFPAPDDERVLVAAGPEVLSIDQDAVAAVAEVEGEVVDLHASEAGADFSVRADDGGLDAVSLRDGELRTVASGDVGELRWSGGTDGQNLLQATAGAEVRDAERTVRVEELSETVSLDGETVVELAPTGTDASDDPASLQVTESTPGTRAAGARVVAAVERPSQVIDASRQVTFESRVNQVCAIPRNDPTIQVIQPSPAQVEWAAHRAVRGELTLRRPANWQENGLPSYVPQTVFPPIALDGGGRIPAQVLLGVLAQESNFWQAARGAVPGVAANPLIGNYYGVIYHQTGPDAGKISSFDLSKADCGYGVGQITDGMEAADTGQPFRSASQQKMIATDYAANIAEAQRILATKWNDMYGTLIPVGTDPALVENWYLPLWAYNCCYYGPPLAQSGMGWTNNPANSDYRFDRLYFMREGLDDAKRPGDWSYPERVMGFIEHGLWLYGERAFTPIVGTLDGLPVVGDDIVPFGLPVDRFAFCDDSNDCSSTHYDPFNISGGTRPIQGDRSFCTRADRRCWWGQPLPFEPSQASENIAAYLATPPTEPGGSTPYPPACGPNDAALPEYDVIASVPSTAVIVDDVPRNTPNVAGCSNVKTAGTFEFSFGADVAEIDLHQIGTGYGGHFWYGHTVRATRPDHRVTGTWRPTATTTGWRRIMVHIPPVGADTYQADYQIFDGTEGPGESASFHRVVNQRWNENRWVDLGVFELSAGARVELSNVTYSDHGDPIPQNGEIKVDKYYETNRSISIAWDAMAFLPAAEPQVAMVSFGDSYSSGEGNSTAGYYPNSDVFQNSSNATNACHRTPEAYGPLSFAELERRNPGSVTYAFLACSGATLVDNVVGPFTHWGEIPQQDTGWVDQNTTHITVGIGGNDVRFSDILLTCLSSVTRTCNEIMVDDNGQQVTINERLRDEIDQLGDRYRDFVDLLRAQAPGARIVLVGYPYVIGNGDYPSWCTGFSDLEIEWLQTSTDRLNQMISSIADARANVEFAPISAAYRGHEACTDDEFINGVDLTWTCGACDDGDVLKAASFHPNAKGHAAAAPAVIDALTRPSGSNTAPGVIRGEIWKRRGPETIGAGLPVELFLATEDDQRGAAVASTSTNALGFYSFANLASGCYVVAFVAPPGQVFDTNRLTELDVVGCVQNGEVRQLDGQLLAGSDSTAIEGRIEHDGDRIPGVRIELFLSNEDGDQLQFNQETVSNDNSIGPNYRMEVANLDPPCWLIRFHAPPGYAFEDGSFVLDEHRCIGAIFDTTINIDLIESSTPTVSVESIATTETNGRRRVTVRFVLDQPAPARVRVRYATEDETATVNADYQRKAGTVTFRRGQRVKTVRFVILGDRIAEQTEQFRVSLSAPTGLRIGADGLIQIDDND
ncbi:MAG: GDSL-type esterase/lipase family protein [Actinomycetota bacterium]